MATILLNCNRLVCQRRALRKLMCQPGGGFYGNLCLHFNGIRVPLKGGPYGFSTRNAHIIRPAEADSFSGGQVNFLKRHWWPFAITGRHSSPRNNQPPPPTPGTGGIFRRKLRPKNVLRPTSVFAERSAGKTRSPFGRVGPTGRGHGDGRPRHWLRSMIRRPPSTLVASPHPKSPFSFK